MGWDLCLVVTIYERDDWMAGLQPGVKFVAEKRFMRYVPTAFKNADLADAMREVAADANKWLGKQLPDLCTQVVVTLYSLEVK